MSVYRIRSLLVRGAAIQSAIDREQSRPRPDGLRLLQLKKLRLLVSDRLNRLKRKLSDPRHPEPPGAGDRPLPGGSRQTRPGARNGEGASCR